MSHFALMVVGGDVGAKLYPFWELDLPREELMKDERAIFQDMTEEVKKSYNEETVTAVRTKDGIKFTWDESFRIKGTFGTGSDTHKIPDDLKEEEIPFKEMYKSMDEYAQDWSGYKKTEDGRYGYWKNPNAKWDWYQVGGRYSDWFIHKENPKYPELISKGSRSLLDKSTEPSHPRACDSLCKCDIDIDAMMLEAVISAEKIWDKMVGKDEFERGYVYGIGKEETKEQYVERRRKSCLAPFAILMENLEWIERGKMGWWAIVSDEKDKDMWLEEFKNIFNAIPDDELITIVDCHI